MTDGATRRLMVSWKQSSFFNPLGTVFCFKILRVCLNSQNVPFQYLSDNI